jgi:putative membrane protein
MANERTFLAWIRTSISVMAFGFVVERFSLFVRQMSAFMGRTAPPHPSSSAVIGIILVGIGALMGILAFFRFRSVERQIDEDTYAPSPVLYVLLTLTVLAIAFFLVLYLYHSM